MVELISLAVQEPPEPTDFSLELIYAVSWPNGNTTTYAYNDLDQLIRIEHPAVTAYNLPAGTGTAETMTYDALGNLLTQTDRLGLTRTYTYTARNQVDTITRSIGGAKDYDYDLNGNLTSETDWKNIATSHTYDELNRRVSTTNRLDHAMAMGYDLNGNLTSQTDYNGNTTTTDYDRLNRPTQINLPDLDGQEVVTINTYYDEADPDTNLHTVTDPEGRTTTFAYNGRYLRTSRINAVNDTYTWTWDDAGNLSTETDEENNTTRYDYDQQNRRTDTYRNLSGSDIRTAHMTYDNAGNIISVTDANDHTTKTDYDQWNRPWRVTQPGDIVTSVHLDGAGNKTYEKDGNGHERTWAYNPLGLLISHTDAENNTTGYSYDLNNNL